jgi:hypothetical protein
VFFALLLPVGMCHLAWAVLILLFCGQFLGYVLVLFGNTVMMMVTPPSVTPNPSGKYKFSLLDDSG